jgi:hypothetical protein
MDTHLAGLKYLLLILKYNYLGLQLTLDISGFPLISYAATTCLFSLQVCAPTKKCIKQTAEGRKRRGGICFKKAKVKF